MDADIRPLEPADPRVVGGHPLLGRLGSGGMGTVYLGTDPESGGRVAVKTIHPHLAGDPSYRRRFKDEAYLASRVASFCTARVLAHGEEDGRPYLVTDYVGGVSLHDRLAGNGPLPPGDLHGVAVGVASALAAIHAAGLVHRDLKPANVMLTLSGCRVIDFGIAGSRHARAAGRSAKVLGTPGWMAPEVLVGGAATPAADIFAWGCLIAHAGTGRMPFGGAPATLRVTTGEPDLEGLPEPLVPVVRSALAKNPAARPTAADLLLTLVEQPQPCGVPAAVSVPDTLSGTVRSAVRGAVRGAVDGVGQGAGPVLAAAPSPAPRARTTPRPSRPARAADTGVPTKTFAPLGMTGVWASPRARLLAGAGAAAGTVLLAALIAGLQGRAEARAAAVRYRARRGPARYRRG
ncbi:serine/threonine-protein kinase [Actinomadura sp. WMMB 499]|uniref:serine/threonine-protein kinase n=1 Tax=Actinomadura sp. WMMB 499 TaxID=1219491 RepID=UPI0012474FA0|nr:serine/threonine-protein kinase [Actinomadura sp. WMMB 499]QFG21174.1 serine/threonine protein kinase [Actinomadura sp. WMMB 499]